MNLDKYLFRIQKLHKLIDNKNTGTPEELSRHLGISRRSVYIYMSLIKDKGGKIAYNKTNCTYYYTERFDLKI